nr:CoA-binding protein [Actinomycetota bacterium]
MARLLRPRSVAVVGASPRTFVGGITLRNLRALGFAGTVTPVNPRRPEIDGVTAAASLAELDHTPDVAVLLVGADRVLQAARDAVDCGVRGLVVPGAGHTDSGAAADAVIGGLRDLAAANAGVAMAGPNCMGYVDLVTGAAPYVGTVPEQVRAGRIGVVAQSGAVVEAVINAGGRVPLSTAVSSGAEAVIDLADYLRFFAADEHTDAVLAFVEAFADPAAFLAAAQEMATAGKPLAVCKVGRSAVAQTGVTAHSGKLAGSHRVAMAAMRQAGAIVCDDLDELLVTGELLATGLPRGVRLHVVANSGGEANLLADLAEDAGLRLPPMSGEGVAALRARWPRFT